MAKTSGPLMSLDASGTFGKTLTFSKWKGRNTTRLRVTPANPRTTAQQDARAALSAGGKFNSKVMYGSPVQIKLRDTAPSGQSGPSYFAKLQRAIFSTSKTDYNNATYSTQKGYFDSAAASLGLTAITIPGDTPLVVPAGLILWNAYQAMYGVDPTIAPTTAKTATASNITTFTDALEV